MSLVVTTPGISVSIAKLLFKPLRRHRFNIELTLISDTDL